MVNRGVLNVLNELEVEYIDNLILSVSGQGRLIFFVHLSAYWKVLPISKFYSNPIIRIHYRKGARAHLEANGK